MVLNNEAPLPAPVLSLVNSCYFREIGFPFIMEVATHKSWGLQLQLKKKNDSNNRKTVN